jgi:hypothetical protein
MLLPCFVVQAQQLWSPDTLLKENPNYVMDRYHDFLRFHDPYMYLTYPVIKPIIDRKIGLEDGEGKDGYWLEGNFAYRFTIYQGKYYSYRFFQRMRPTLDIGLLLRLTKDYSSPLLPANNKVGLGFDFLLSKLNQLNKKRVTLVWTTLQLHHYSNGQADSFFIDNTVKRNNYRSGDFSTNYYKVLLNVGGIAEQRSIVSGAVGYQKQINLGGPLASSKELNHYYGSDKLLINFQWAHQPKLVTVNYQNRATTEADTVTIDRRRQVSIRSEFEYIIKGVSSFAGDNKARPGWHIYFTYMPSVTNEVGFIFHTYAGRDYLNIRFDDVIFAGELGVYVKFNGR